MTCPRCAADPGPHSGEGWKSAARRCAFDANGLFFGENWSCATMRQLRRAAAEVAKYSDEQYAALLPIEYTDGGGFFLLLTWYKSRGKTEGAWVVSDDSIRPLTLTDAERWIAAHPQVSP